MDDIKTYELIINPTVKAEQITPETIGWVSEWCKGRLVKEFDSEELVDRVVGLNVPTLKGVKTAEWGWYVLREMSGDFRVMDPLAFGLKYRLVVKSTVEASG